MLTTSSRLLQLLTVLSSRPSWTAAELAGRVGITERTVRRDITRLRDLGYDVRSDPGRWGGYQLAEVVRLPATAITKLGAIDDAVEQTTPAGEVSLSTLAVLAMACRKSERIRLSYRDMNGRESVREADPHRLVHTGHRWYLVARDVAKDAWRTFRADRVTEARPTGRVVRLDNPPDAAQLVASTLTSAYPLYATVRIPRPLAEVITLIPPTTGEHRADGPQATIVEIGGTDAGSIAGFLLRLGIPLSVLAPDEVRAEVRRRALELAEHNADRSRPDRDLPSGT
ncbi:WYL domain-containing protein [Lentzea sp. NPDC034063]|uniref:helix-turn-helix transcriptional regulator n=1 Tax=unclassified Lentzea TaxID=2643253 RepID=UPI0033DB499F